MWKTLGLDGWYTILVVGLTFFLLIKNTAPADVIMVFTITLLLIANIITPSEALAGKRVLYDRLDGGTFLSGDVQGSRVLAS